MGKTIKNSKTQESLGAPINNGECNAVEATTINVTFWVSFDFSLPIWLNILLQATVLIKHCPAMIKDSFLVSYPVIAIKAKEYLFVFYRVFYHMIHVIPDAFATFTLKYMNSWTNCNFSLFTINMQVVTFFMSSAALFTFFPFPFADGVRILSKSLLMWYT